MTTQAAVLATFVKLQTMADGSPRVTLDLQCSLTEIAAMGAQPGAPFALARITNEAAQTPPAPEPQHEPKASHENSKWTALRCKEKVFREFLADVFSMIVQDEEQAANTVRAVCRVSSRADLDTDPEAAARFHERVRKPFADYMRRQPINT